MALLNIAAFDVYRFSLPFIQPMKVGSVLLNNREGLLIALTDDKGRKAFGEAAPVPGWDQTSLESCRSALSVLRKKLFKGSFNTDHFDLSSPGLGMISLAGSLEPHTLFGLESALLSLYLQDNPTCVPDIIRVPVNGLFIPNSGDDQADVQIRALQQSGMKTIKVKIGRIPADQEIRQILRLADAMGNNLRLRLDGNRSLSASSYSRYFRALGHLNVEYAEEPLQIDESSASRDVPWPIALDESLPPYLDPAHPGIFSLPENIRTVILKPGLLSGLSGMASFIAAAQKRSIQTVLSSSFNTGVSLAVLGLFSRLAGLSSDIACGFDTLKHLQADVLNNFPSVSDGALTISRNLFADMHLNSRVLIQEDL